MKDIFHHRDNSLMSTGKIRPRESFRQLSPWGWPGLLCLVVWLNSNSPAWADLARQHQSFQHLILPGGRAAMLGGAYTALSNDPSGSLYNPAGIVQAQQNQVSLNSWSTFRSETVYEEAVKGQDFNEKSNTRFGGFAGGIFQKKPFTLGYVITTLDKRNINQDDYFHDLSTEDGQASDFTRIHQESNSYDLFGASMALALGKFWSLGFSGFYYDRSIESMDYQQVLFNGGQVLIQESKIRVSNQGFIGISGIQFHGEDLSIGLSVRSGDPTINHGTLNFNSITHAVANTTPEVVTFSTDEYNDDSEIIPMIFRAGVAWHPAHGFLISSDVSYSAPVAVDNGSSNRLATINYAFGLETGPSFWHLMLGVFSNNSNFPEVAQDGSNQSTHLNYVGKSIGSSITTKTFDLFLGYIRQDGLGESQIVAGATTNQKVRATMENVLVSWTFKL